MEFNTQQISATSKQNEGTNKKSSGSTTNNNRMKKTMLTTADSSQQATPTVMEATMATAKTFL